MGEINTMAKSANNTARPGGKVEKKDTTVIVENNKKINFDLNQHIVKLIEPNSEPFFAAISRKIDKRANYSIPTAGVYVDENTNQFKLIYNPEFMDGLSKKHITGVLKHEFYHLILGHVTTRGPQGSMEIADKKEQRHYHKKWNCATDLAINSLIPNELPEFCLLPGRAPFEKLPLGKSSEWYYKNIEDESLSGVGDESGIDNHDGWGEVKEGEEISKEFLNERLKDILKDAAREASGRGWGTVSEATKKIIMDRITPKINWQSVLAMFIKASLRSNKTPTSRRVNRRFPYMFPGKKINRTSNIAIAIDQSGSVSDALLAKFFSELDNLSAIATFTVIPFDHDVHEQDIYVWSIGERRKHERVRCGGTDFDAPTKWVNNKKTFDGLIILTDLEAPAPVSCCCQRVWITDETHASKPYFNPREKVIVID